MFSRRELIRRMASVPVLGPILGAGATDADVSFWAYFVHKFARRYRGHALYDRGL
jgi:hypothetical protein